MDDTLAMFFGAKKARKSPKRKSPTRKSMVPKRKSAGTIVVRGRVRKLHRGVNGGLFYRTTAGKVYVKASPKRRKASPKRRKASPKRRKASPKRRKSSPKRRKASPKRRKASMRYGYGLGQPSLIDMMGPANLSLVQANRV